MKYSFRLKKISGLLIFLLILTGCSQSRQIADLSMQLHDKYKTYFLHAEMRKHNDLFLIFRIDSTQKNQHNIRNKAFKIASFAYSKVETPEDIKNITIRFQHIGAPTVITDPHAHVLTFSTLALK